MSLNDFVKEPDVREAIKCLRPDIPRKLPESLRVAPPSRQPQILGIAFDYLFRFEMQRRAPRAKTRPWVADHAADLVAAATVAGGELRVLLPGAGGALYVTPPGGFTRAAHKIQQALDGARDAVAEHVLRQHVLPIDITNLAAHALRLAKLDLVYRAGVLDTRFAEAEPEYVQDLVAMLELVPWDQFVGNGPVLLNPIFGSASHLVGGADADLITGDLLVDIKTVKDDRLEAGHLDQLLGYFLLSRRHRISARRFPKIERVGLYYARRGYLLDFDTRRWTENPDFKRIERWFFERALTSRI